MKFKHPHQSQRLVSSFSNNQDTGFNLTRSNFLRISLAIIMLATLVLTILTNIKIAGQNQTAFGAAPVTPPPTLDFSAVEDTLPETKPQAGLLAAKYGSNFNFEKVASLNRQVGAIAPWAEGSQNSVPNSLTPLPTNTPANALTPAPTESGKLGVYAASAPVDGFESPQRDDTAAGAKAISVATAQTRTFDTPADIDWVIFVLSTGGGIVHSIMVTPTIISGTDRVDPVLELYDSNFQLLAFNDNNTISGPPPTPGARIDFTPPSSTALITYYIKIYSAVASAGTGAGEYTLGVERGRSDGAPSATFTPVFSPTASPTTVGTPTPTATPNPCRDIYEDDGDPTRAKLLKPGATTSQPLVGTPGVPITSTTNNGAQRHYSCPKGDVDWVYMDLVKGKPYSVFTSDLTNGIDTYMALYQVQTDGKVVPIFANDDFPGMNLASRIDWVVPADTDTPLGEFVRYYLALKDVASNGEPLLAYNLNLVSPGNAIGQCFDAYEPNSKPQDAKEILLNETQTHTFCPQNDNDWVKFFAKKSRSYTISTSFFTPNAVGLDTKLSVWAVKFDSEGVSVTSQIVQQTLINENDDRSDADLSSSVSFSLPEDGIYFAQITNAGGTGRNDLFYKINFAAGGTPGTPQATTVAATTTVAPSAPTPTINPAAATATASIQQTLTALAATQTALVSRTTTGGGANTATLINLSGLAFADPSFQRVWDYADLPVFQAKVSRTWLWGKPGPSRLEIYNEALDGMRQVQYFDKSRMEINNTKADRNSKWFVSNGLLVKEMILGKIATGNNQFADLQGASLPIAGDLSSNNSAPNYAVLAPVITVNGSNQASNRVGQVINDSLNSDGKVATLSNLPESLKMAAFIKDTGHNIPDVFWKYLATNNNGLVYDGKAFLQADVMDWVFVMGLPLSEPYWTKAVVGGVEKDVLVQIFERRVLTYTPSNPSAWQVEMGNVGQHYFLWRYGN